MSKRNSQIFTAPVKNRITWPQIYFMTIGVKMTDNQTDKMTSSVDCDIDWYDGFCWSPKKMKEFGRNLR